MLGQELPNPSCLVKNEISIAPYCFILFNCLSLTMSPVLGLDLLVLLDDICKTSNKNPMELLGKVVSSIKLSYELQDSFDTKKDL
jgi:hypothetical protein